MWYGWYGGWCNGARARRAEFRLPPDRFTLLHTCSWNFLPWYAFFVFDLKTRRPPVVTVGYLDSTTPGHATPLTTLPFWFYFRLLLLLLLLLTCWVCCCFFYRHSVIGGGRRLGRRTQTRAAAANEPHAHTDTPTGAHDTHIRTGRIELYSVAADATRHFPPPDRRCMHWQRRSGRNVVPAIV